MDLMTERLLGFFIILTRVSAFFMVLPIFGQRGIPVRIKVAMVVFVSLFFLMIKPVAINPAEIGLFEAVILLCAEAIYGLALGLILAILFSAVKIGGRIIERQMGFAMAQTLDPLSGEMEGPLGMLLESVFILLFLSANGHHLFFLALSGSFESFPPGSAPTAQILAKGVVEAGSVMFMAGLRLAAPLLAVFFLVLVILAVLARMVPEMDILFLSFPIRIGMGLLLITLILPFLNGFVKEFSHWMLKLLPM